MVPLRSFAVGVAVVPLHVSDERVVGCGNTGVCLLNSLSLTKILPCDQATRLAGEVILPVAAF